MKNIIAEIFTRIFPLSLRCFLLNAEQCVLLRLTGWILDARRQEETGGAFKAVPLHCCFAAVNAIHHLHYSKMQLYSRRRKKPGVFSGVVSLTSFSFCTATCCTSDFCRRKPKLCTHAAASAYALETEGFRSKSAALLT